MTLFREKANPKLELSGRAPALQRRLYGLIFLGSVLWSSRTLGLDVLDQLTPSLLMHLTTWTCIEYLAFRGLQTKKKLPVCDAGDVSCSSVCQFFLCFGLSRLCLIIVKCHEWQEEVFLLGCCVVGWLQSVRTLGSVCVFAGSWPMETLLDF